MDRCSDEDANTSGGFFQDPPRLGNTWNDPLLKEYLSRHLPASVMAEIEPNLRRTGELAVSFWEYQLRDRTNEPRLVQWSPWGRRIDEVEVTDLWRDAARLSAELGLVAVGYEQAYGEYSRTYQFALNYLVQASLDFYSCPLAMTDGAARVLLDRASEELIERAVPRLLSRDPETMWTSGQWMTERTGGSDVGLSETVARKSLDGWRLFGTKWFTSAVTSQMALTLARPEANLAGSRGLALFYVETRRDDGLLNGIRVNRLKDKLGTRKVPTAELTLDGARAVPVCGLEDGVRAITPMLTITRLWNSIGAVLLMRRALDLARDYATRRVQFGTRLADKPLHVETLAGLEAETAGAMLLAFEIAAILGRLETGAGRDGDEMLLRVLTPIAKLTTARQAVAVVSEAIECFGGAGYVEDTGLPMLLRDAQVLPIWEGTTNVLALDTLRAFGSGDAWAAIDPFVSRQLEGGRDDRLAAPISAVRQALDRARAWSQASEFDATRREAGARGFAMTVGRTIELALLVGHARWCVEQSGSTRAVSMARRFSRSTIDLIDDEIDADESHAVVFGN